MDIPWLVTAKVHIGTEETPGSANNEKILRWARIVGGFSADYYKQDSIPWCGLFVAYCMATNGLEPVKDNPLGALNWAKWGTPLKEPALGCVMVFKRTGGGHVGFYVGEDAENYHILGGNQSDEVNVTKVAKSKFVAARWPTGMEKFLKPGRIKKKFDGKVTELND